MLDVPERYKSFLFKSILISSESPLKISFLAKLIGFPDTEINSSDRETSFPEKEISLWFKFRFFELKYSLSMSTKTFSAKRSIFSLSLTRFTFIFSERSN